MNAAFGERRVFPSTPWIAIGLYWVGGAAGEFLAERIDPSLGRVSSLRIVALLIVSGTYIFALADAVYELKVLSEVDRGRAGLAKLHQVVWLFLWFPVGIYMVQKDLNEHGTSEVES